MALHNIFASNAVGAQSAFGIPGVANLLTRNEKAAHKLGEFLLNEGGIWRYVKFGEDVSKDHLVMFDERFGGDRPSGEGDPLASGNNGALKVKKNTDGGQLLMVGAVVDADVDVSEAAYGWVLVQGLARVRSIRGSGEAIGSFVGTEPASTYQNLGVNAGRLGLLADGGARILNLFIVPTANGAGANEIATHNAFLNFPIIAQEAALANQTQPDRTNRYAESPYL